MTRVTLDEILTQLHAHVGVFAEQKWRRAFTPNGFRYTADILQKMVYAQENQDADLLEALVAIAHEDGIDQRYTPLLLRILPEAWHHSTEDMVVLLRDIRDPASVDLLYRTALAIPFYDDARALAKKCIWALRAVNTPQAREMLQLLSSMGDWMIEEAATAALQSTK